MVWASKSVHGVCVRSGYTCSAFGAVMRSKTGRIAHTSDFHPHVEADRLYFDAMVAGDYEFWRKSTLQDIEEHGHQETLNWLLMLGAMAELGGRKPQEAWFVESWLTNANKVFAVFRP
jgi:hypothetical protein